MSGKIEKQRFAEARAQLKGDLELYLLLQNASGDDVEGREALIEIAWEAVQRAAQAYSDAGAAMGFGPERAKSAPGLMAAKSVNAAAPSSGMSTEELMK